MLLGKQLGMPCGRPPLLISLPGQGANGSKARSCTRCMAILFVWKRRGFLHVLREHVNSFVGCRSE